jgi:glycosyltransferase involved in cell wall biosynthesis
VNGATITPRMRVGLATEILVHPPTGVEVALLRQIAGLAAAGHAVTCFHSADPRHPTLPGVTQHRFRKPLPIPFYHRLAAFFHRSCFEGVDVLHLPYPQMPYARKPRVPVVITVHDLSPLLMPDVHPWKRIAFFRHALPWMLRGADRIVASSASTKADLIGLMRLPEEKIDVVPLCVDLPPGEPAGERADTILYVGTVEPRKNLPGLLRAFARVKAAGAPHAMVIAGGRGYGAPDLAALAAELGIADRVVLKGYVSDAERERLYREAALVVYPSLHEGFGLPVLEAMAHGTPVVASNTSAIPEVAGDAALLADPRDDAALAAAILEALRPERARELGRKGRERAAEFSASRMVGRLLEVYEEVA